MSLTRRTWIRNAVSTAAAGLLGGCGQRPSLDADGVTVLRYASPYSSGHPFSRADIRWMRSVEQQAGGALRFKPFWGGALMGESDTVRELGHGVADVSYILPIYTRAGAHLIRALAGFCNGTRTMEQQEAVFYQLWQEMPALQAELPGVHMLLATGGLTIHIMTADRPVRRLEDLRGLHLRTSAEVTPILNRFGVDAEFMPMGEVYTAISKGTIDGVAAPLDAMSSMRFAEVVRHVALLDIPRGAYPSRAMNLARLRQLPETQQQLLASTLPEWQAASRSESAKSLDAGRKYADEQAVEIVSLAEDERQRFSAVYDEFAVIAARQLDARGMPGTALYQRAQAIIRERGFSS